MKLLAAVSVLSTFAGIAQGTPLQKRAAAPGFTTGSPDNGNGKGGPILGKSLYSTDNLQLTDLLGGTNKQIDLQNPDNLGRQSTDAGTVVNLKWSFSDSKTKIFNGGWTRTQVVTDLPSSHDIILLSSICIRARSEKLIGTES